MEGSGQDNKQNWTEKADKCDDLTKRGTEGGVDRAEGGMHAEYERKRQRGVCGLLCLESSVK